MFGKVRGKQPPVDSYAQGLRLYENAQYEQALEALEAVRGDDGARGQMARYYCGMAHRRLGLQAMRAGDFVAAERHLLAAVREIGRDADLAAYLAGVYARTRRYELCEVEMAKSAENSPDRAGAARRLAQAQWRAGRRFQAVMTLQEALRSGVDQAPLHLQLGLFHAVEGALTQAVESFRLAAESDPGGADGHYYLGLAAAATGDTLQATRSLQRALELRGGDLMAAYQLSLAARAAQEKGHPVTIRLPETSASSPILRTGELARYVAREPDILEAFHSLPESQADAELFGVLASAVRQALAEHPSYADLHWHLSRVYRRLGRTREAMHEAYRALEINPDYVQGLLHLSGLCADCGRYVEALAHLELAIVRGADWPDVHCSAAELLKRCGRKDRAAAHLRRALMLKSDYKRAAEAMQSLAA